MKQTLIVGLIAGLALSACSTAPLTVIADKQVYIRTVLNRQPVTVEAIDGIGTIQEPIFLEPGIHKVTIAAPPQAGFREPVLKTYTLNLSPCTRYYIAADRANRLTRDWTLVIENQEPTGGCDVRREWEKAGMPERGTETVPPSAVIVSG